MSHLYALKDKKKTQQSWEEKLFFCYSSHAASSDVSGFYGIFLHLISFLNTAKTIYDGTPAVFSDFMFDLDATCTAGGQLSTGKDLCFEFYLLDLLTALRDAAQF